jgi:hypothetical protein
MQVCRSKRARSTTLTPRPFSKDIKPEVQALVCGEECIRVVLNKYIDGLSGRTQYVREEEKYYRCKRNTLILKEEQGESLGYQHQLMPKEEEEEEEEEEYVEEE